LPILIKSSILAHGKVGLCIVLAPGPKGLLAGELDIKNITTHAFRRVGY